MTKWENVVNTFLRTRKGTGVNTSQLIRLKKEVGSEPLRTYIRFLKRAGLVEDLADNRLTRTDLFFRYVNSKDAKQLAYGTRV
jgi:hypothetical protein